MAANTGKVDFGQLIGEAARYRQSGNLRAAKAVYTDILRKDANNAEVLHLLGCLTEEIGGREQAIKFLLKAIKANPIVPAYHYNLANMFARQGSLTDAVQCYRDAIKLKHDYAFAHNNLGRLLSQLGQREDAKACFKEAIAYAPRYADPLNSLSLELKAEGDLDGAVAACQAAISLKPDFADAHCNLGGAYLLMQRVVEAANAYQAAVNLRPSMAIYRANLGGALLRLGRQQEAVIAFEEALRLDPHNASMRSNRILASSYTTANPFELWSQVEAWDRIHGAPQKAQILPHPNKPDPERSLRVGFVSADFRNHAAAYWIEPLLEGMRRCQLAVVCYSNSLRVDTVTERLKGLADEWVDCAVLSDMELANRIRADGIDILVDLSSHTEGNRLLVFSRQPAPVQVSWFGFPVSTGLHAMHYRLTDAVLDPIGQSEAFYSERLVRLDRFYSAFRPDPLCGEVGVGPVVRNGFVTFASFNTLSKITSAMLECWAAILIQTPHARLLLQAAGIENPELAQTIRSALGALGVAPDRLILRGWTNIEDYMRLGDVADITLDPFPFNGGVTTCHALWLGLPVITQSGDTAASRVGASILTRLGLAEWVAHDSNDYVLYAIALASDTEKLAELRASLRTRMEVSGLLDGQGLASEVETAFRAMWSEWCAAQGDFKQDQLTR